MRPIIRHHRVLPIRRCRHFMRHRARRHLHTVHRPRIHNRQRTVTLIHHQQFPCRHLRHTHPRQHQPHCNNRNSPNSPKPHRLTSRQTPRLLSASPRCVSRDRSVASQPPLWLRPEAFQPHATIEPFLYPVIPTGASASFSRRVVEGSRQHFFPGKHVFTLRYL